MAEERRGRFQGSDTSRAEVTIYCHGDDPIVLEPWRGRVYTGGSVTNPDEPSLIRARTSKRFGAGAGSFSFTAKVPPDEDLLDSLVDDDWVDLSFSSQGRRHHAMRGIITDITRTETEVGVTYEVMGREFSYVFEITELWFNRFTAENVTGEAALRAYGSVVGNFGTIEKNVATFLTGFLREIGDAGRSLWDLPRSLPGARRGARFVDLVAAPWSDQWSNEPERHAFNATWGMPPESNLWALASEWSDPDFTEMFPELLVEFAGVLDYPSADSETTPDDTRMAVVLRDRPFPTAEVPGGFRRSLWFRLPEHVIPMAQVKSPMQLSRSGRERHNAFFVSPVLTQQLTGAPFEFSAPLWDPVDIRRHGLRRYDLHSRYVAAAPDLNLTLAETSRRRLRDWHVLNPYFRSGNLMLAPGRPEIRLGSRLRIVSPRGTGHDLLGYVEGVDHEWGGLEAGVSTQLAVTRMWKGTEDTMLSAISRMQERYITAGQFNETPDALDAGEAAV